MSFGVFQFRRGTAAQWTSSNPVLSDGELGLETDTSLFKIGNGVATWTARPYGGIQGSQGIQGIQGIQGVQGETGWSPILSVVTDGARRVFQITSWVGGAGTPPSSTNQFIGPVGIVGTAAAAVDVRGVAGADGAAGSNGVGVPTGGTTAQYLRKIDGTNYNTQWAPVGAGEITNAMQSNMAANTLSGNNTGAPAAPMDLTQAQATALMNVATQSLQGMLSALDKKIIDNLHYDFVADFGGVRDDSTLNDAAMVTALSTMPAGAVLFFPAGTYRFAAAIDINVDKRLTFKGVNRYASIIKTTSATAHIFTKSVAGWYDMWTDLGFQSSVTKTAGAAINIPQGNNIGMNVYRCWFTGMFQAINATGNQSANLSVWADLDISAVTNGGRGIFINGATINVMIHNVTINAGAATTSACVEIQASGAVQVTNCDWIQGTNIVLFNAAAALGAQACYFTNCFFDQPQGSVVKIVGGFTSGRLNFAQCGIAPTGNNHAIEVAGTGAGAVGTATALPAGIKLVGCDIYSANGTNTGAGVRVNGCQDITVQNCNIAGFNGAGGAAVWITPSASNQTKVRINGNILGPNSNLTINNATGVKLDAGASALGFLSITDNSMIGSTTAIADSSTALPTVTKNINNNQGAAAGLATSYVGGGFALGTTEVVVAQLAMPANAIKVGTTFKFMVTGTAIITVTTTVRLHIGIAGTVADAQIITTAASAAGVAGGLIVEGLVQITSVGGAGVGNGAARISAGTATSAPAITATGTYNSAIANYVSVGMLCSAAGHTVRAATLECISPA